MLLSDIYALTLETHPCPFEEYTQEQKEIWLEAEKQRLEIAEREAEALELKRFSDWQPHLEKPAMPAGMDSVAMGAWINDAMLADVTNATPLFQAAVDQLNNYSPLILTKPTLPANLNEVGKISNLQKIVTDFIKSDQDGFIISVYNNMLSQDSGLPGFHSLEKYSSVANPAIWLKGLLEMPYAEAIVLLEEVKTSHDLMMAKITSQNSIRNRIESGRKDIEFGIDMVALFGNINDDSDPDTEANVALLESLSPLILMLQSGSITAARDSIASLEIPNKELFIGLINDYLAKKGE